MTYATHINHPLYRDICSGCDADLSRTRCHCDDEERCGECRLYHRPSEDCEAVAREYAAIARRANRWDEVFQSIERKRA